MLKSSKRAGGSLNNEQNEKKKRKTEDQVPNEGESETFLSSVKAFILQAGIQKMRMGIFKSQLTKYGGTLCECVADDTTHIVVDDNMTADRLCKLLKVDAPPENITIVKSGWLSSCFGGKECVDTTDFLLDLSVLQKQKSNPPDTKPNDAAESLKPVSTEKIILPKVGFMFGSHTKPAQDGGGDADPDSDYVPSGGEEDEDLLTKDGEHVTAEFVVPSTSTGKPLPTGSWTCAQSSFNPKPNVNKHITDKLEDMVRAYESTNDKWRAFGYQKAITVLKRQAKAISTFEEAVALPGVGKKLAEKIWEIVESGELRKLNEFKSSEDIRVIEMFKDVWGAGPHTARTWYQQGLRTLEDLKTKANLTHQQNVGLQHYDDFLDRMPREEAGLIEQVVKKAAEELLPGVIAQACGSYRRGCATCGDVDVLVTHPDGKSHKGIFSKLLHKLKEQGFLTDDLVTAEDNGNQKKYLGVCKLPAENTKYRRIDIIVIPYDEYACALVYFTGSAHFNRSLRHLAKKKGMSLSEHSLNSGVVRNGAEKIYEGTPLPTRTEEAVFTLLGVPHRPPNERDH